MQIPRRCDTSPSDWPLGSAHSPSTSSGVSIAWRPPIATAEPSPSAPSAVAELWRCLAVPRRSPALASWWFTEPLPTSRPAARRSRSRSRPPPSRARRRRPDAGLAGGSARRATRPRGSCCASTPIGRDGSTQVEGYTATFRKQERIGGKLGPEQTLAMKVRNRPFAIYLKFLAPKAGKEVVYAEGHHDNKVIAHNGDWTRRLVPRLAVAPDSPLALADSRHPVTEAGLVNLPDKLLHFRKLDMGDPDAVTDPRPDHRRRRPRLAPLGPHPPDRRRPPAVRPGRGPLRPGDPVPAPDHQLRLARPRPGRASSSWPSITPTTTSSSTPRSPPPTSTRPTPPTSSTAYRPAPRRRPPAPTRTGGRGPKSPCGEPGTDYPGGARRIEPTASRGRPSDPGADGQGGPSVAHADGASAAGPGPRV